jgi:cytochrome c oxidase assembly factor CtaG
MLGSHCLPVAVSSPSQLTSHIGVIDHMNTKMILAAIALSLTLAACAKKDEATETAQDAAETAGDAAAAAGDAATDAAAAAGDAATAAGDASAAAG